MTKNEEFDKDFDFEKEYGFDPKALLDPEYENGDALNSNFDASFDEDFIKDFDEKFGSEFDEKFTAEFGPVTTDEAVPPTEFVDEVLEEDEESLIPGFVNTEFPSEYKVEEPTKVLPAFDLPEFDEKVIDQSVFEDSQNDPAETQVLPQVEDVQAPAAEEEVHDVADVPRPAPRRRKLSKERLIKEVYLPPIIAGLTIVLCLTFIIGGIVRAVGNNDEGGKNPSASEEDAALKLKQESQQLLAEAKLLAAGYDYQAALDKLNSFSDKENMDKYPDMITARSEYATMKDQVQAWNDPSSIANLSFHTLIVDPTRAFADKEWGPSYKMNFVTVDEFKKILDQIYANGYVLVDFDSFVEEVAQEDGTVTYKTKPIYLPVGKKPFMLSTTLVNYFEYMIGEDTDGKYGDGFARKLLVENGKITNEYQDASGNITYGSYDLIPILEDFIEAHPDFAYQGARALVAFTGEEGVFGYRTMPSVIEEKGQEYYDNEVANAKEVAQKLRDLGYTLACGSYGNENYGNEFSATDIKADIELWQKEVTPVIGEVDTIIYAKGSDITTGTNYTGNKYNVLQAAGFRYFVGAADVAWAEVTNSYVRQTRLMVTGTMMQNAASTFASFFDAKTVLCIERNLAN